MIYISSSCSKQKKIGPALKELVAFGFRNIELSGGTDYYQGGTEDILEIQAKYDLNLLVHNYFPPPKEAFVLNLASLNNEIYEKSIDQILTGIKFSRLIGSNKFGFHAGYFVDLQPVELGEKISQHHNYGGRRALKRFYEGFNRIIKEAGGVDLYLENNVYSRSNFESFGKENPFMLTSAGDWRKLLKHIQFNLLLDIAHLHVSSRTLGFNFKESLQEMIVGTDYIHISDNDGLHDQNLEIGIASRIMKFIEKKHLQGKTITLEIGTGLKKVSDSLNFLTEFMN